MKLIDASWSTRVKRTCWNTFIIDVCIHVSPYVLETACIWCIYNTFWELIDVHMHSYMYLYCMHACCNLQARVVTLTCNVINSAGLSFFNHVNVQVGVVSECCTNSSCPTMTAGKELVQSHVFTDIEKCSDREYVYMELHVCSTPAYTCITAK